MFSSFRVRSILRGAVALLLLQTGFAQTSTFKFPSASYDLTQNLTPPRAASAGTGPASISLQDALARARANSQQYLSAVTEAAIAKEERIQGKAGLLPSANVNSSFLYTEGNGTPSGVFAGANGVHEYDTRANVHEELSMTNRLEYRRSIAAEAVARARQEVALRGLTTSVVQNYYALVAAQRKVTNAQQSLDDARNFVDITQKLETGGEVAHADVIKAQILLQQRQRDARETQLGVEKARVELAVFIFPDFNEDFTVLDDLLTVAPLSALQQLTPLAAQASPDLRAAQSVVLQEAAGVKVAKSAWIPSLTLDYFYGIDANRFAIRTEGDRNLGSGAQATLNVPVWNWGATKSRIRQAELKQRQAELDLTLAQKQLSATLSTQYREAQVAQSQLESLKASLDLAVESLRLTLLRYQAAEVGVLEVVDAQTTLTETRDAYDQGLARYRSAWANIEILAGNL